MNTIGKVALLSFVAGLAACSDTSSAPRQIAAPTDTVQGSLQDLTGTDTIRFTITINPYQNTTFYLGSGNSLYFPAGSLCSLSSSYGKDEWDKPCTKATSSVSVNVKAWLDRYGKARVDFDKHVRFVPTTNPVQFVVLQFADLQASLDPFFNILYCPALPGQSGSSSCYDEAKKDPSLLTVRNPLTGKVTRRIKHFSGYNVAAGEGGEGESSFSLSAPDLRLNTIIDVETMYPDVRGDDAAAFLETVRAARRAGYILASG